MSATPIGITGATGRLGGRVARRLAERGVATRLLVRDPARAPELAGAEVARITYDDTDEVRAALTGIEVLFMVSAAESAERLEEHRRFVAAAAAAGVRHVVYTSFVGAGPDATFTLARDHGATEQFIREPGMTFTFLRDDFYLDIFPLFVDDTGALKGPAGDGAVAAVAIADVARVAEQVLTDPAAHADAIYDLTGPEALTLTQIAAIITEVTGRPTRYVEESVEEAYASRRPSGAAQWQLDAWVSTYTAIATGELATVTYTVERLTGRPPLTLADVLAGREDAPA